jgi:hypothetical protein
MLDHQAHSKAKQGTSNALLLADTLSTPRAANTQAAYPMGLSSARQHAGKDKIAAWSFSAVNSFLSFMSLLRYYLASVPLRCAGEKVWPYLCARLLLRPS